MKHELLAAGALDTRTIIIPVLFFACAYAALYAATMSNVVPFPGGQDIPGPEPEDNTGIESEKDNEREDPKKELVWCEKHQTMHWPPACR